MSLKKYILILLATGLLFSCKSALDKSYNAATLDSDIEDIRKSDKVNEDDLKLLVKYLVVIKLSRQEPKGSYSDILERIKKVEPTTTIKESSKME